MKHLIILFYIISFTIGFSFLLLGFFIWLKNKQEILKFYIISAFSLTLILLEQTITSYDTINIIESNNLDIFTRYISTLGCGLMIYAMTKLVMILTGIILTKKSELLLIAFSILPLITISLYYLTNNQIIIRVTSILFFGSVLYNIIVLVGNINKIDN